MIPVPHEEQDQVVCVIVVDLSVPGRKSVPYHGPAAPADIHGPVAHVRHSVILTAVSGPFPGVPVMRACGIRRTVWPGVQDHLPSVGRDLSGCAKNDALRDPVLAMSGNPNAARAVHVGDPIQPSAAVNASATRSCCAAVRCGCRGSEMMRAAAASAFGKLPAG